MFHQKISLFILKISDYYDSRQVAALQAEKPHCQSGRIKRIKIGKSINFLNSNQ